MNVLADAASYASASASVSSASESKPPKKTVLKKKSPKLQHILMKLLNDESAPESIWWLPGEKEFAINADKFPAVLDAHLPGTKYASFIRRLHKLGFSRQTRSLKKVYGTLPEHAVAFHHEKFRRDRPELMDELKNGYWKESKARKAREEAEKSPPTSPPAVVTLPETVSSVQPVKPSPPAAVAGSNPNELLEYAEALRQKNQVEQQEREVQLMLLRQRVAQEQAEMEHLLLMRQQRHQQEHFMALLQQQQQWAAMQQQAVAGSPDGSSDVLLRLQLQQQAPFNPYGFNAAAMY